MGKANRGLWRAWQGWGKPTVVQGVPTTLFFPCIISERLFTLLVEEEGQQRIFARRELLGPPRV
jgi:hypothetical protein